MRLIVATVMAWAALVTLVGCCGWHPCHDECALPIPDEDPCKEPDPIPCKPMAREPQPDLTCGCD